MQDAEICERRPERDSVVESNIPEPVVAAEMVPVHSSEVVAYYPSHSDQFISVGLRGHVPLDRVPNVKVKVV